MSPGDVGHKTDFLKHQMKISRNEVKRAQSLLRTNSQFWVIEWREKTQKISRIMRKKQTHPDSNNESP